jgi:serine/threonine protein kinase
MTLANGSRLGHYTILAPLGAGGMAQVYRARDDRLDREVAIKVLKDGHAGDPDWIGRFEREARLLASLNHPGIATLHGRDEVDGVRFLVMELVPGQSLAERLAAGKLPLAQTLEICRQIAVALEAAHERGVIHRDLKPANVMITPEGQVKILDFGLAVSASVLTTTAQLDGSTQLHQRHTAEGVIVGTPAYMAPEQARGKPIDRRCDIWAFGCVLFEAVTGRPSFGGETYSDLLAAVLERSPDWDALPARTPPRLADLLRRCLQKDPARRLRDIGDARLEIEEVLADLARPAPPNQPVPRRSWRPLVLALLALLAVAVAFLLGWRLPRQADSNPDSTPYNRKLPLPVAEQRNWSGERLIGVAMRAFGPRLSPDGRWLAYIVLHRNIAQLAVMDLSTGTQRILTRDRTKGGIGNFCWTDDCNHIYYDRFFTAPVGVYRIAADSPGTDSDRTVLADVECPQVLSDKTLLVTKLDEQGNMRLWRHDPAAGGKEIKPILKTSIYLPPGVDESWWPRPVRALRNQLKIVFAGKLLEPGSVPKRRLYSLDLSKPGSAPEVLYEDVTHDLVSLAVSPDDRYVYIVLPAGESVQVTRVPISKGDGPARAVLNLTSAVYGLDVDQQERLYIDQFRRPVELLRFQASGGAVERLADLSHGPIMQPVELPDGRLVLPSRLLGRNRLLLAGPRQDAVPLRDDRETRPPVTVVGEDRLAFVDVHDGNAEVVLAAINENFNYLLRFPRSSIPTEGLTSLAASPDGKTIYFVRAKGIYSVPAGDNRARPARLADGDGVAVHPNGKELVIQRFDKQGARLFRLDPGKPPSKLVPIEIRGELRLAPDPIGSRAIAPDGRMVVAASAGTTWYWWTALLEGNRGELQQIKVDFDGDIYPANWDRKGNILALGYTTRSDIWRFTPRKSP